MGAKIARVEGVSRFFRAGDEIVSIDGRAVADQLDAVYLSSGDGAARIAIERGGDRFTRKVSLDSFARSRIVFEEMRFMRCRSRCLFCFMDQMPAGLRPSLYEKDDDYRLSFLYGNFVTLNDVTERELDRIASLRLSPLFVSVHAVDRRVRERIFGRRMRRDIVRDLRRLARAGVAIHAQIVLVPGVNDGPALERTVETLGRLYPGCRSVAIVPVGVTAHRRGLPKLRRPSAAQSRLLVAWAERLRERWRRRTGGESFLHLADEIYLASGRALPAAERYDGYPQLSNGVGMCRLFLEELEADAALLARRRRAFDGPVVVTGELGARFLRRYAEPLLARALPGFRLRLLRVPNELFGPRVGVSGLLVGRDIIRAAGRRRGARGCLVIPGNSLDHEGRFLDDLRPADVARALDRPVVVARRTFLEPAVVRRCAKGAPS